MKLKPVGATETIGWLLRERIALIEPGELGTFNFEMPAATENVCEFDPAVRVTELAAVLKTMAQSSSDV